MTVPRTPLLFTLLSAALFFFSNMPAASQPPAEPASSDAPALRFRTRSLVPAEGIGARLKDVLDLEKKSVTGKKRMHVVLQLRAPMTRETRLRLEGSGISLLLPIRERGWFASIPVDLTPDMKLLRSVCLLPPRDKVHPLLQDPKIFPDRIRVTPDSIAIHVVFHFDVAARSGERMIRRFDPRAKAFGNGFYEAVVKPSDLLTLAREEEVMWIEPGNQLIEPIVHIGRESMHVDVLQNAQILGQVVQYNLSGRDVQVAVFDTGIDPEHDDFAGRLLRTSGTGDHGTHVGGIIGGSGALSETVGGTPFQLRGMAPRCELISYGVGVNLPDYQEAISTYGADISSNSIVQSVCMEYDARALLLDQMVLGSAGREITIVFGAGNNGTFRQYGNLVGYFAVFTSAKNTISVGATNKEDDSRASFSAMGPTFDGRTKPDVMAPGCAVSGGIIAPFPGDTYMAWCGTSMATPSASGAIALLFQKYARVFGVDLDVNPPCPSSIKAILAQTAGDLIHTNPSPSEDNNPDTGVPVFYHRGPDYATGYGLINAEAASNLIGQRRIRELTALGTGLDRTLKIQVPQDQATLRVTLAWDDLPGNPAEDITIPKLMNDLDLVLESPSQTVHRPWILDPLPHEPYDATLTGIDPIVPADIVASTRGVDSLNNLEQILVNNPEPGTWTLRVAATSLMTEQIASVAANVPLKVVSLDMTCVTPTSPAGRVELTANARNNLDQAVEIRAEFSVENCNGSSIDNFLVVNRSFPVGASRMRMVRVRLPAGLDKNCDLTLKVDLFDDQSGELLTRSTCVVQIPE